MAVAAAGLQRRAISCILGAESRHRRANPAGVVVLLCCVLCAVCCVLCVVLCSGMLDASRQALCRNEAGAAGLAPVGGWPLFSNSSVLAVSFTFLAAAASPATAAVLAGQKLSTASSGAGPVAAMGREPAPVRGPRAL